MRKKNLLQLSRVRSSSQTGNHFQHHINSNFMKLAKDNVIIILNVIFIYLLVQ